MNPRSARISGSRGFLSVLVRSNGGSAPTRMPHVFELADRIHIQRLGARAAVITPMTHTMEDAVAIMTGARQGQVEADAQFPEREVASPEGKS